jgi:peptide/nickel transport system permease protein
MQRFIAIRFLQSLLALWVMSIIVFGLARMSGNPLDTMLPIEAGPEDYERLEKHWGLDKPLHEQYFIFITKALQGDFGQSLKYQGQSAMALVAERLPATLELAGVALLVSIILALPIGVLAAVQKGTRWDTAAKIVALLGQSLPSFWLGIVLMWIFAVLLGWLPASGRGGFSHLILPAIALGWFQVAVIMRLVRSSMLEVMDSEFVKLARVKGIPEWKVIWKHCLRNASIAPLTRRVAPYRFRGDRNRFHLARRGTAGRRCREVERLSGGTGRRDHVRVHFYLLQPAGRHHVRVSRPAHPVPIRTTEESRSCRN